MSYAFTDIWAPALAWSTLEKLNPTGGAPDTDYVAMTDFTAEYDPTTSFRFRFTATDRNGDLISLQLYARQGATRSVLFNEVLDATSLAARSVVFTLPSIGDWRIFAVAADATGRTTELELNDGLAVVTIKSYTYGAGTTHTPVASPAGGAFVTFPQTVTLTCDTVGASVWYMVTDLYAAPSGAWSLYSTPIAVDRDKTLSFMSPTAPPSPVVSENYEAAGYNETTL